MKNAGTYRNKMSKSYEMFFSNSLMTMKGGGAPTEKAVSFLEVKEMRLKVVKLDNRTNTDEEKLNEEEKHYFIGTDGFSVFVQFLGTGKENR